MAIARVHPLQGDRDNRRGDQSTRFSHAATAGTHGRTTDHVMTRSANTYSRAAVERAPRISKSRPRTERERRTTASTRPAPAWAAARRARSSAAPPSPEPDLERAARGDRDLDARREMKMPSQAMRAAARRERRRSSARRPSRERERALVHDRLRQPRVAVMTAAISQCSRRARRRRDAPGWPSRTSGTATRDGARSAPRRRCSACCATRVLRNRLRASGSDV